MKRLPSAKRLRRAAERGVTMLIVLVLLSVMLLGGLALARLTEVGTIVSGNSAYHQAALAASEVGLNTAFAAVQTLADENTSTGGWYSAVALDKNDNGLPKNVDWTAAPSISIGALTVSYVAERACTVTPVTDPLNQCLVRQDPKPGSRSAGIEQLDPPNARQFRVTVRVTDAKGTQIFVQSLITKGT